MTVQELKSTFNYLYQKEPDAVYFAPGRVNLIGEHTDYKNDLETTTALSFGVYLLLCKNTEKCIKLWSLNEPAAIRIELNQLLTHSSKTSVQYPVSVFAEYIKLGVEFKEGFDILMWGNIPKNAIITSMDALKIITAYALDDQLETNFIRSILDGVRMKEDYKFTFLDYDILKLDVTACYLQYDTFQLLFSSIQRDFLPIGMEGIKIIISNTHTPHKLDSACYNQRMVGRKIAVEKLNSSKSFKLKTILTEDNVNSIESSNDNLVELKRFSHVLGEVQRFSDGIKAIKQGDFDLFGRLMNASHLSLRDNYDIVSPEVDLMVTEAWKINGVLGSRMTAGGFGGCTVSLVRDEAIDTFITTTGSIYEAETGIKPNFFIAEIGDCACKLN